MRKVLLCIFALLLIHTTLFANWHDARSRGLIPFWINAGHFYTLLVFVSGNEQTPDTIHVRFCDDNGYFCSDTTGDMFAIRSRDMLAVTTKRKSGNPRLPVWMPTTASYGYAKFRARDGLPIHACALIINELSGATMVVPAYNQDTGF